MLGASGGGSSFFFLILIAFAFIWFFIMRPQKKRQMQARQLLNTLNVGDNVVTAGGIYGEITSLDDESVMVRIAPELEVRVARKAIGAVLPPEEDAEAEPEADEPHTPENDG